MIEHVGFLAELPVRAVLDGELVAFGADGKPDFELVCERAPAPSAGLPCRVSQWGPRLREVLSPEA